MTKTSQLDDLFADILARRGASPDESYSAQLLADLPRAARKLNARDDLTGRTMVTHP